MKKTLLIFLLSYSVSFCFSQTEATLKSINTTWAKFYKAFETLDDTLMAEIHTEDLVRISGGKRILDYHTYIDNYKIRFERDKNSGETNHISLRFFERLYNDTVASERGIYKLIRNKGTDKERVYYGQFHVLFKKIDGEWKITMDYDSSENGTIGENQYNEAFAIDNFDAFLN